MKVANLNFPKRETVVKYVSTTITTAFVLCFALTAAHAGTFTTSTLTGDADCGVSDTKTYTHAYNVGSSSSFTINGVTFTGVDGTTPSTSDFSTLGFGGSTNGSSEVTGQIGEITKTLLYGVVDEQANPTQGLTLDGLEIGTSYVTTFYNISWGPADTRWVTITPSDDTTGFHVDENFTGTQGNDLHIGNMIKYAYTATDTNLTFTFAPDNPGDSFHFYGFSNEVVEVPEPSTIALLIGAFVTLVAIRRMKK